VHDEPYYGPPKRLSKGTAPKGFERVAGRIHRRGGEAYIPASALTPADVFTRMAVAESARDLAPRERYSDHRDWLIKQLVSLMVQGDYFDAQIVVEDMENADRARKGRMTKYKDALLTFLREGGEIPSMPPVDVTMRLQVIEGFGSYAKHSKWAEWGVGMGYFADILAPERATYGKERVTTSLGKVRPPIGKTVQRVQDASLRRLRASKPPAGALGPATIEMLCSTGTMPLSVLCRTVELGSRDTGNPYKKAFGVLPRANETVHHLEEQERWPKLYAPPREGPAPRKLKGEPTRPKAGDTAIWRRKDGKPVYALPESIPFRAGDDYFEDGTPKLSGNPGVLYRRGGKLPNRKVKVKGKDADDAAVVVVYSVYGGGDVPGTIHSCSVPSVLQAKVSEVATVPEIWPLTMPWIPQKRVPAFVPAVYPGMHLGSLERARQHEAGVMRCHDTKKGPHTADPLDEIADMVEDASAYEEAVEALEARDKGPKEEALRDELDELEGLEAEEDPERESTKAQAAELAWLVESALTQREWDVVKLAYEEELSNDETAERLGVSKETVQKHINNARKKIRLATGKEMRYRDRGKKAA
jgi:RNA polymerase sigma factor (sigma-70 family)